MAELTVDTAESIDLLAPRRSGSAAHHITFSWLEVALSVGVVAACSVAWFSDVAPLASAIGVVALLPAAIVDRRSGRLPDRLVAFAAAMLAVSSSITVTLDATLTPALVGVVAFAGPLLLLHLISPSAMGFGDVKAGMVLGACLGIADPALALLGLTCAALLGSLAGIVGRQRTIAFGPALVLGSALALLVGPFVVPSATVVGS